MVKRGRRNTGLGEDREGGAKEQVKRGRMNTKFGEEMKEEHCSWRNTWIKCGEEERALDLVGEEGETMV